MHIDADYFKRVMPEWPGYTARPNSELAGSLCHQESGYMQELAQEVALSNRQNIWIDGSLGDHEWYLTDCAVLIIRTVFSKNVGTDWGI